MVNHFHKQSFDIEPIITEFSAIKENTPLPVAKQSPGNVKYIRQIDYN